jgi:ABC-2 type transport system ATP-binding protein
VLSTHILPEVSQTCSKVVIINKGKVVAIDTPDALTERLRGTVTMFVAAEGNTDDLVSAMRNVQGVVRVAVTEARDGSASFEVDSEKGADIRRGLAHAIVGAGHGLLELRPMRMSLEDIFLSLTTEEQSQEEAAEQEAVGA